VIETLCIYYIVVQWQGGGSRRPPQTIWGVSGLAGEQTPAGTMLCLRDLHGHVPSS